MGEASASVLDRVDERIDASPAEARQVIDLTKRASDVSDLGGDAVKAAQTAERKQGARPIVGGLAIQGGLPHQRYGAFPGRSKADLPLNIDRLNSPTLGFMAPVTMQSMRQPRAR